MRKQQVTLTALFVTLALARALGQPAMATAERLIEPLKDAEALSALARLGDLSPGAIRERLAQLRPQVYLAKDEHLNQLVKAQNLSSASGPQVDQLKAALQPVLAYHQRSQMPIVVLWSDQPKAYLIERTVIILTTRLMKSASAAEIRGAVAHELAHEYVWNERLQARAANDEQRLRECELFCDAVAAFTLKELGDDPASYGRVLERLTIIGITVGSATSKASDTHPALAVRKKLNQFLCQRLD